MSFFNRKEEVLDLELTQYGKKLLSNGKFKPDSYAFFDDDIVYDTRYMTSTVGHEAYTEQQNQAQERIRTTPRIHAQYNFRGIEANINSPTRIQNLDDAEHYMKLPIGRCSLGSENAPSWDITYLKNEILSSSFIMSGTDMGSGQKFSDLPIPQLSSSLVVKSFVEPTDKQVQKENIYFKQNFKDENTTIRLQDDFLLIEIQEENVPFESENVSIEVYEIVDTDWKGNQILEPLHFFEDPNKQKKVGEIYEEPGGYTKVNFVFNEKYVDYYLDIRVDNEIDQNLLCNHLEKDKVQSIFDSPINCSDIKKQSSMYGPLEDSLGEPCTDLNASNGTTSPGSSGGAGGGGY
jgi:hypothetical protein